MVVPFGISVQRRRNETGSRRSNEVQRAPDPVTKRERLLHNLSGESQGFNGCSVTVLNVDSKKPRSILYIRDHST